MLASHVSRATCHRRSVRFAQRFGSSRHRLTNVPPRLIDRLGRATVLSLVLDPGNPSVSEAGTVGSGLVKGADSGALFEPVLFCEWTGDLPAVPRLERRDCVGACRLRDGAAGPEGAAGRLVER